MRVSKNWIATFILLSLAGAKAAQALPIGFGRTQADLEYSELKSDNFYIYHDARTPREAAFTLRALEAARPVLSKWFLIERKRPLPVIMSAATDGASFANFITDAIELQTLGEASRDLAWHEYTHSTMYRHFDNILGPAGSVLHLPWMPAWWIEGLAEAMSVSVGSDLQAGFERHHALSGKWPTYDRLHSLYSKYDFVLSGYATAGAFVSYILRKSQPPSLAAVHEDFFWNTMPWWWPWALTPFSPYMPMDDALEKLAKKNGIGLYEQYKQESAEYWQSHPVGPFLFDQPGERPTFPDVSGLQVRNGQLFYKYHDEGANHVAKVRFREGSIWASGYDWQSDLPDHLGSWTMVDNPDAHIIIRAEPKWKPGYQYQLMERKGSDLRFLASAGDATYVSGVYETPDSIVWVEQHRETTKVCNFPKTLLKTGKSIPRKQITCPLTADIHKIELIGVDTSTQPDGSEVADRLWFNRYEQTLTGDRFQLLAWDTHAHKTITLAYNQGGRPLSMVQAGNKHWLLVGERSWRSIRHIDPVTGTCLGEVKYADTPAKLLGLSDGSLVLPLYADSDRPIARIAPSALKESACEQAEGQTSPLLVAMRHQATEHNHEVVPIAQALQEASIWQDPNAAQKASTEKLIQESATVEKTPLAPELNADASSTPAHWRPRPVFGVPWLGADAEGTTFGVLSVPLMDHMQNETLRATVLFGLASRYPDTELTLTSTRFWPVLNLDAFRYQSWDGVYYNSEDQLDELIFVDEKGLRLTSILTLAPLHSDVTVGMKSSIIKPYIGVGNTFPRAGHLNEPFARIDTVKVLGKYTLSGNINGRTAPASLNSNFDYNEIGAAFGISRDLKLLESNISMGVDAARMRGPERRELQELYRPLRVFVPGDGGGFNNLNLPLITGGGLFSARYGEDEMRSNFNWVIPIIKDVDTLFRLFYIERLDLTAFFNYGGAWSNHNRPERADLIAAHGYNLDLHIDVKGIKFNVGAGTGQVLGAPFELYLTFGFDAIL